MIKQPKYFYKSESQAAIVSALQKGKSNEQTLVSSPQSPNHSSVSRFPIKSLFVVGFMVLGAIGIFGMGSQILAHHLTQLHPTLPPSTQALLEQKSGPQNGLMFEARTSDARPDIIQNFLARYNSSLKPYDHFGKVLVETADRYGIDYRLLPAIMMQESNLCKASDPTIHNCLGFGINKAGTLAFATYEDSFDRAARELKQNYIDEGLTTPEQIMHKYTPSSNGSWASSVNQWIAEMEHNDPSKGISEKQNADLTAYTAK